MKAKPGDYISTLEASQLAKVDYRTIRRWCYLEYLEAFKISGSWVVSKASLEKFLRQQKVGSEQ